MKYLLVLFSFLFLFRANANDIDWIIKSNAGNISQAVLTRDNKFLLTVVNYDSSQKAQVWSLIDNQKIAETIIPGSYFDISTDGNFVVFSDNIRFGVWDIKKNTVATLDSLTSWNWSVKFIPISVKNYNIYIVFKYVIYDYEKKIFEKTINLDSSDFKSIVNGGFKISPDGNYLLCAAQSQNSSDTTVNEIYLLDLKTGVEQKKRLFSSNISDFDWSPDSKNFSCIFSESKKYQFQVVIFDAVKFDTIKTIISKNTFAQIVKYDITGKFLDCYARYYGYRRFDITTGDSIAGFNYNDLPSANFSILTSDRKLIGILGSIISIYNSSESFKLIYRMNQPANHAHSGSISSVDLSTDNKIFATCGNDTYVKLWSADNGDFIADLTGHTSTVLNVKFSPDGKYLASGGAIGDNRIIIWDIEKKSVSKQLNMKSSVTNLVWSPDSKRIYTTIHNDSILILDASTGNILKSFYPGKIINTIAVTKDETKLVYGTDDRYLGILDLSNGNKLLDTLLYTNTKYGGLKYLEFDENYDYLVAGCGDFNARLFDTKTWTIKKIFPSDNKFESSIVSKAQFSRNNLYLVLTLIDIIKVSDISIGQESKLYTDFFDPTYTLANIYNSSVIAKNDSFILAVTGKGEIIRFKSWIVTDVKDIKTNEECIKIYPNPSQKMSSTIEYVSDNLNETNINIFDINSKLVYHDNITSIPGTNQYTFPVNQLVNGTYWVVIRMGDKMLNTKFVSER